MLGWGRRQPYGGSKKAVAPGTVSGMNRSPKQTWWSEGWGGCGHGVDLTVLLLVMLHLAVTLPLAFILNIWVDEAYSLHTTSGSLTEAFAKSIVFEQQAPAYFLLLDLWRTIDPSAVFARLLSVLCTASTLVVAARISQRLFPGWSPAWMVAFLAFNPTIVWAAVEARVYPMAILAATLVLFAFGATVCNDTAQRRSPIVLALAGGLALYTQYYLGFLLAALGLGLVIATPVQSVRRYAAAMAGVAVVCLPIAFWLPSQLDALSGASSEVFDMREAAGFWLHVMSSTVIPGYELLGRLVPPESYRAAVWIVRLGLTVAVVALLIASRGLGRLLRESSVIIVWVALLAGAACFSGLGLLADASLVSAPRHWSFLSVLGAPAFMSLAWATGRRKLMARFPRVGIVLDAVVLVDVYRPLAKEGDSIAGGGVSCGS